MEDESYTPVCLATGSNLGDRQENLAAIRAALPPEVAIEKASSIYQTEPWGVTEQPDFLNQVLLVRTRLSPRDLLAYVKGIEDALGRVPGVRYGPRQADIDIIIYGDLVVEEEGLIIPHPRFQERAFVLVPLVEICPDLMVPGTNLTAADLLQSLDTAGVELFQE